MDFSLILSPITSNTAARRTACQKSPFWPLMAAVVMTLALCTHHIYQIFAIPLCRFGRHQRDSNCGESAAIRVVRQKVHSSQNTLTCNCGSAGLEYTPTRRLRHNCPSYNVVVLLQHTVTTACGRLCRKTKVYSNVWKLSLSVFEHSLTWLS